MEFPCSALPLESTFYIERPPIETLTRQELEKPGSLIRIKAPRHMGKSSLLVRLIAHAQALGYRTVNVDFQSADSEIYASLPKFLRWFCKTVARQLNLDPCLENYWDDDIGAKLSCTFYFDRYLLAGVETPIFLALNEVNQVFEHPEIAQDFLPMLRYWHEQAKQNESFHQLRIAVVHSTEIYIPLNINQSPFNVGLPVHLRPFDLAQVQSLAQQYHLEALSADQIQQLMDIVGGHPYLISKAFYYLSQRDLSFEQLLRDAPTQAGIYSDHLREHFTRLQRKSQLKATLYKIMATSQSIEIEPAEAHQLESLGLIVLSGNKCLPACELYRQYFNHLALDDTLQPSNRLKQLEAENQQLKELVNIDGLTRIANRRYFDQYLHSEWRRMIQMQAPLSLILLDIDCFKCYNDTYGHLAGDVCLRKVAQALCRCTKRSLDLVARYGGEEFVVILSATDIKGAQNLAEKLLMAIKQLNIEHVNSVVPLGIITASMGVACVIPHLENQPHQLVKMADEALYRAKEQGRDRVSLQVQKTAPLP